MTRIQSTSNSAATPAATHQSAETLAAYGSAQPVPSRLPSHLHQGSMNEVSDQHNVLLETTLVELTADELGLIGNFLPLQDVRAFESTNRMLRRVAEQGSFNGLKQEPIVRSIRSLEELERITPVCNRLNEQGYKIHLHLNSNQPLTPGVIPAGVQLSFARGVN